VLDDPSAAVGELMAEAAAGGRHIVLTGGSTPRAAYEHAAGLGADWSRATFWFGDERCVPPDHEQSNFAMAEKALLGRIEAGAVHRMKGELGPAAGADDYERQLRTVFGDEGVPRIDLILLGLGPDAHCASLFPGDSALGVTDRLVTGVEVPGMARTRRRQWRGRSAVCDRGRTRRRAWCGRSRAACACCWTATPPSIYRLLFA